MNMTLFIVHAIDYEAADDDGDNLRLHYRPSMLVRRYFRVADHPGGDRFSEDTGFVGTRWAGSGSLSENASLQTELLPVCTG
jgi:hypothetical protein